jgi:mono/diheme cytochrome c family protein
MGRIYRIVHDDFKRDTRKPNLLNESSSTLITYLNHPNGWWRDNAQQLLIIRNDQSVVTELKKIALGETVLGKAPNPLARIHALWTLEGLDAIDKEILFKAFEDTSAQVRKTAVWISEKFIKKNDKELIQRLSSLQNDPNADVRIQLMLSLRSNKGKDAQAVVNNLIEVNSNNQLIQYSYTTFKQTQAAVEAEKQRTQNLSAADRKLVTEGATIYKQLCATCHGADGRGVTIGGKDMPAPPLAGSPRVKGDKIALTQLLLYGLTGPVDGKTYPDRMPAMGGNSDEWLASVLSYIRNSGDLANKASVVTPDEVKEIRANTPNMKEGFTLQLLEIFKLGRAENTNWKKAAK